ncbi:MAG: chromate transporter [Lachnospiraceae bacterium]|nr:chromate transporter [Lachnospiraceae bacterium]MBR1913333.1 chromate transporter [Lachnospiraceae bacterium]
MKELFELYLTFLKIGAVNFGGGYAMLPLLEEELNKKRGWVTTDELMDYFAIGQCTPGIIALNVSTFIGNKRHGVAGAAAATLGFLTCPIIIIIVIAAFLTNFADIPLVQNAFAGIRVCVCVLILEAVLRLWKKAIVDRLAFVIYIIVFILMAFSGLLPVKVPAAVLVIAAGVAGILIRGHKEAVS